MMVYVLMHSERFIHKKMTAICINETKKYSPVR
jgi:hypothetical protein